MMRFVLFSITIILIILDNDYRNIENLYENVSENFGYKVKPPEEYGEFLGLYEFIF